MGVFAGNDMLQTLTIPFVGDKRTATLGEETTDKTFGYIFADETLKSLITANKNYEVIQNTTKYYLPISLKTVNVIDDVDIRSYAFQNAYEITSISLPSGYNSTTDFIAIGAHSLQGLSKLQSINEYGTIKTLTVPSKTEVIGDYAFEGCGVLSGITLPDTIKTVG